MGRNRPRKAAVATYLSRSNDLIVIVAHLASILPPPDSIVKMSPRACKA